jgi:putative phage-type endonuclease
MKIHNLPQQSKEWFEIRVGKMTSSHTQAIANQGKGLDTYITELMAEYYSSGEKEQFSNKHTDRGNELEPLAREMYELETGNKVEQVGFCEYNEFSGVSPDGFVNVDGLIEIKAIDDVGYFKYLLNGDKEIDSKYIWQVQMQLMVTNRQWCDFVAYNPNYKKSLFIHRIYPDLEKFKEIKKGLEIGKQKILDIKNKLN